MPKMKTNRAAAKRYRVTGTGKVRRNQAKHRHLMTAKSPKAKRHSKSSLIVHESDTKRARRLLGM